MLEKPKHTPGPWVEHEDAAYDILAFLCDHPAQTREGMRIELLNYLNRYMIPASAASDAISKLDAIREASTQAVALITTNGAS